MALCGLAVSRNPRVVERGRRVSLDLIAGNALSQVVQPPNLILSSSRDEEVARRVAFLTDYQDAAYARRYADVVERARTAEAAVLPDSDKFARAVARTLFRLMAYKDEYEVARLQDRKSVV